MKCPKCGYLGFEDVRRCRNCGYDFSLTSDPAIPDLLIRRDDNTPSPLDDLALVDGAIAPQPARMTDALPDLDRLLGVPAADAAVPRGANGAAPHPAGAPAQTPPSAELPLFRSALDGDQPLITKASPPRAPLAVRRSTPDALRVRTDVLRTPSLDLSPEQTGALAARRDAANYDAGLDGASTTDDAAVVARFVAVAIDLALLAAIDVLVVYFTLQVCGITVADLGVLPKGPLAAFLLVQNLGYLVAFTAGGQTLGKMAAGIRVVSNESTATLDLGRAFLRTAMWVLLAVPAGLGFVSAIISRDHRGLHDRFAGTRVVRVSA
jgi:uncharacterized RDD family membrane protein YckC